jgi:hypothetical protein
MARFSAIVFWVVIAVAGVSAAAAQESRPYIPRRSTMQPGAQQQQPMQPNPQQPGQPTVYPAGNMQQQPSSPGQPPTAPLKQSPLGVGTPVQPTTPAVPPLVTYRDGLLTVQAANSTLNSVLNAIRSKSGIEFEGQENVISDRVALSLGPAPAGEVLSAIFAGSKFDFVAIGRPDNPGIVQRVILSPKAQGGAAVAAGAPPQPRPNNNGENADEEDTPDETPNAGDPQDTAVQQPQVQQPQPQPENNPQSPKTPEQLLQELKEMKQQQQGNQPPPNPGQVPRKMPPR